MQVGLGKFHDAMIADTNVGLIARCSASGQILNTEHLVSGFRR